MHSVQYSIEVVSTLPYLRYVLYPAGTWRNNNVATSFWRNNDVVIALLLRLVEFCENYIFLYDNPYTAKMGLIHEKMKGQMSTLYMFSEKVRQINNNRRWFYIQLDDKYKTGLYKNIYISYRSNCFVPNLALKSGFGYLRFVFYSMGMGPCIVCGSSAQNAWTYTCDHIAVQMNWKMVFIASTIK